MKAKRRKPAAGAYKCPCCGRVYKYKSMAQHCTATEECRFYNTPEKSRLESWKRQAMVIDFVQLVAAATKRREEDVDCRAVAEKVLGDADEICRFLKTWYGILANIAARYKGQILACAKGLWGADGRAAVLELVDVAYFLTDDVIKELSPGWETGNEPDGSKAWAKLKGHLDEMSDLYADTWDGEEGGVSELDAYDALHACVFGRKSERPVSLYLVDDSLWCAAHGRAELRQWLHDAGHSKPKIEGVAPGAKLENGMTAAWLVSQAKSIPAVVGRDE